MPQQKAQRPAQRPVPAKTAPAEEKILAKINRTRLSYLKFYVLALIMFMLWAILQFSLLPKNSVTTSFMSMIKPYNTYLLLLLGIGILFILIGEMKIRYERYYLTSHRVRQITGFFGIQETDFEYNMISHYSVNQNFIEKFFSHGTVLLETVAGGKTAQISLNHIPHIKQVKAIIDEKVSSARGGKF